MSRSRTKLNKFIDLFAGIGGFRVALERLGNRDRRLQCVFSSEIDKYAREAYLKNFGEEPINDDITKIETENISKEIPDHDVLCAGFPCQAFSISGNRQGLGDDRGKLFHKIAEIAKIKRPKVLLLENVKNIRTMDNGAVIEQIKRELKNAGYEVNLNVLNSSDFGIPQKRERVYFVCLRDDLPKKMSYKVPSPTGIKKKYLHEILEEDVDEKLFIEKNDYDYEVDTEDKERASKPIRIGKVNKGGQGERIYHTKGQAITLSASSGGPGAKTGLYYVENKGGGDVRRLSLNECKVLMGFRKSHKVSDGAQGYKQLGNAVIPPMVRRVFDGIKGF